MVDTCEVRSMRSIRMTWNSATCKELRGVIVFTDPDYNGEQFARSLYQGAWSQACLLNRGEAVPKSKTKDRSLEWSMPILKT